MSSAGASSNPMASMTAGVANLQKDIAAAKSNLANTTAEEQKTEDEAYKSYKSTTASLADSFNRLQKEGEENLKPFQAPTPQDPLKSYGSTMAGLMGIASFFTHSSMVPALNAASAAINAVRQGNSEEYSRAFDEWKSNQDFMMKKLDWENNQLKNILDLSKTDYNAATSHIKALSAITGDKALSLTWDAQGVEGAAKLYDARIRGQEAADSHRESIMRTMPLELFNKGLEDFRSENKREPNAQEMGNIWRQAQQSSAYGAMTPDQRLAAAAQAAAGVPLNQIYPGYGKEASAARQQLHNDAVDYLMKQNPGMTPAQAGQKLAMASVDYTAGRRSVGQLTTMLGATRQAISQLDFNIEKTKEEMKKLPSSDVSPVINAIARGEQRWTGNPAYSSLFYYMNATAMESARILQGGQASVAQLHAGAAEEAKKWANVNMTPASFDAVAKAMHDEGENRISTFEQAIQAQQNMSIGGNTDNTTQVPTSAPSGSKDYSNLWGP